MVGELLWSSGGFSFYPDLRAKYFELTDFESVWPDNSGDLSTGHVSCIQFKMF